MNTKTIVNISEIYFWKPSYISEISKKNFPPKISCYTVILCRYTVRPRLSCPQFYIHIRTYICVGNHHSPDNGTLPDDGDKDKDDNDDNNDKDDHDDHDDNDDELVDKQEKNGA